MHQQMFPPRRVWRGPQEERRDVSTETEVRIPNLEALSIVGFTSLTATGFLWWSRFWKTWFTPLIFSLIISIVTFKKQITLERFSLAIPTAPPMHHNHWLRRLELWVLDKVINVIAIPFLNRTVPAIITGLVSFFSIWVILLYWFKEIAWWGDILLGVSIGFVTATAAVVYFHWHNTRDPNWPPPRWFVPGDYDEPQLLPPPEDRSGRGGREGF